MSWAIVAMEASVLDAKNALPKHAAGASYVIERDGRIVSWRPQAEALFQVKPEDVLGRNYVDVIVPIEHREAEHRFLQDVPRNPGKPSERLRLRADGTLICTRVSHEVATRPDGDPCLLFIEEDVSEARTMREGKWLEERFAGLMDAMPDGIVVANVLGRIVLANAKAGELFGYEPEALRGASVEALLPERMREHHVGFRSSYLASPRNREMGEGLELFGLREDGKEFPIEISLSPLSVEDGTLVVSAVRDVSRRRAAEHEFRGLLEAAPDAMVIVNETGRIVLVNSQTEKVFGYDREELLDQPVEVLIPSGLRKTHVSHRQGFFENPRVRAMGMGRTLKGVRKDGTEFPVEISLSPLDTEDGVLISSAIRDISERLKVERIIRAKDAELEKAVAKDRFLASMSHELRTPLNGIIGFAGTMLMGLAGELNDAQKQQLETIELSGRHLLALINQLLDLAKIESGAVDLDLSDVELRGVVELVAKMLMPQATEKALIFEVELPDEDMFCRTDQRMLTQIMINLVSNAIKYTDRGRVKISLKKQDADNGLSVIFIVEDTGIGITEAGQEKLFELFFREHHGTEREGTGIGLYVSQQLSNLLGGRIDVTSDIGVGSRFTFTMPVLTGEADVRPHSRH